MEYDSATDKVPIIPPRRKNPSREPNPVIAICGECGVMIRQLMYFSCGRSCCPIQPQVTL